MSSSSSIRSALHGRSVAVPLIGCPDCGEQVRFYQSSTDEHDGWIFYKCVNHHVTCDFWHWELEYVQHLVETRRLVGDAAVDAIGAAEDRREELERQRIESMAGRGTTGRVMAGRGMAGRANYASSNENNFGPPPVHYHHHQIPFFFLIFHLQFRAPPDPFSPLSNSTNRSPSHLQLAATMVSWDDLPCSSEDDSVTSKPPTTISCEEWSGLVTDLPIFRCGHGSLCEKHVAFESVDIGRRFLACAHKEVPKCRYVEWVDPEWPDALEMSLASIWTMYEEEKKQRLRYNVVSAEENLKVLEEKKKMENELRHFKLDFAKMVAEKEQAISQLGSTQLALTDLKEELEKKKMTDKSVTNIHQVFRVKAEKERDQVVQERDQVIQERDDLKHEKRKLEYMIGDLFKHKEATKEKIRKLKGMLNEFD
ncbi:uncharacterized protein [Aegilops tauschii subsp. strangulata]|uniref:uncharacterized protein n=1 Tax=Aegilops tauschii subsp. strangulata TaxID=200361 RepID=UPI001ABD032D|nr:uncharacterized protein LOC109775942 [Aegilops tauschii subsp. strangulata]